MRGFVVSTACNLRDELAAIARTLAHRPFVALAYCLYSTWTSFVLLGPIFTHSLDPDASLFHLVVPYAAIGAACLALGMWYRAKRPALDQARLRVPMLFCMVAGTACEAVTLAGGEPFYTSAAETLVYLLQCVFVSVGVALFRVEIDRAFGWLGAISTLRMASAGTLLTLPVALALTMAPRTAGLLVSALLPPAALVCLARGVREVPRRTYYATDDALELPFPQQFMATSFVQGLAQGVFYGGAAALVAAGATVSPMASGASLASWPLGILVALIAVSTARLDYNRLIYKVGFPLVALALALLATFPQVRLPGEVAFYAAAVYTDVILWSLGAYIMKDMGMPACWIASLPGAALFGGTAAGACVMWALDRTVGGVALTVVAPLLMACGLLFSSLLLLSERNMRSGWGTFRLGQDANDPEGLAGGEAALRFVAAEYALTQREADVAGAVAAGLTRRDAARELCISEETVKTHLRAIYRKTGTHSQEELAGLVADVRASMGQQG